MFNISRDKERLNRFCMRNAIDCPKYIDESSLRNGGFNYPIIIKPKTGSGAKGIRYIENKEQLDAFKKEIEDIKSIKKIDVNFV